MKGYHFSIKVYKRVLFLSEIKGKGWTSRVGVVSFAAVIRVVTQRSSPLTAAKETRVGATRINFC